MISSNHKVGEIIRIEWDQETGDVRIVIEITDQEFKNRVIHSKDFADIITIKGKSAIVIATKEM